MPEVETKPVYKPDPSFRAAGVAYFPRFMSRMTYKRTGCVEDERSTKKARQERACLLDEMHDDAILCLVRHIALLDVRSFFKFACVYRRVRTTRIAEFVKRLFIQSILAPMGVPVEFIPPAIPFNHIFVLARAIATQHTLPRCMKLRRKRCGIDYGPSIKDYRVELSLNITTRNFTRVTITARDTFCLYYGSPQRQPKTIPGDLTLFAARQPVEPCYDGLIHDYWPCPGRHDVIKHATPYEEMHVLQDRIEWSGNDSYCDVTLNATELAFLKWPSGMAPVCPMNINLAHLTHIPASLNALNPTTLNVQYKSPNCFHEPIPISLIFGLKELFAKPSTIAIGECKTDDSEFDSLLSLLPKQLRHLFVYFRRSKQSCSILESLTQLQALHLIRYKPLTSPHLQIDFSRFTCMRILYISGIFGEFVNTMWEQITTLPSLEQLHLINDANLPPGTGFSFVTQMPTLYGTCSRMPRLRSLRLVDINVCDTICDLLDQSPQLESLSVSVRGTNPCNFVARHLPEGCCDLISYLIKHLGIDIDTRWPRLQGLFLYDHSIGVVGTEPMIDEFADVNSFIRYDLA